MAKKKTLVYMKGFKADTIEVGGVRLGVLRRVSEEWREASLKGVRSPLDALINYASRISKEKKLRDADYVEVTVEAPGLVVTHGGNPGYEWGEALCFKPSRLLRVGIVEAGDEAAGKYELKEDNINWYNVKDEDVYVFEGFCESEKNPLLVILECEDERRILTQCKPGS